MASLTVQQILTRVTRQFGDTANVQIDSTDIVRWVNDAMREIVLQNQLLQAVATGAITAQQSNYTLPNDMLTLRSIKCDGRKLRPMSLSEAETQIPDFDNTAIYPVDLPQSFWIWANQLYLYPSPSSQALQLRIYYTRQPVDVVNLTDVPELLPQYHNRIVEYCLQQAYELDENWAASQIKGKQFADGVNQLKDNVDWVERDFYPFVTSTDTAFSPDTGGYF